VAPRVGLDDAEKRKFLTLPGLELRSLLSCNPYSDTEMIKTKKENRKRRKVTCFMGTVVVPVLTPIQITIGFSAWSEKYGSTKAVRESESVVKTA
jgi:hypothetical protein